MVTQTLPLKSASRTMGAMSRASCLFSRLRAPCQCCFSITGRGFTLTLPSICSVLCLADSVTAVGGTIFVPEIAVPFSGGGFSNVVCHPDFHVARPGVQVFAVPQACIPRGRGKPVLEDPAQGHVCGTIQPVSAGHIRS